MERQLIQQSEQVEAQVVRDLWASAPQNLIDYLGYAVTELGDTLISRAKGDSSILINRTLGLDSNDSYSECVTQRAIETYKELGIEKYFIHVQPDAPDALRQQLKRAGLRTGRAWMKFKRDTEAVQPPDTPLVVKELTPDHASDFGRITAHCFDMTPEFGQILAAASNLPHWHVFLAFRDGTPVGSGCLVTHGNVGLLDMGATDPEFRRMGVQGAVMAARINKAAALGLTTLFTETGEPVVGEAQHSYGNILRYGFKEWYIRQNYTPA